MGIRSSRVRSSASSVRLNPLESDKFREEARQTFQLLDTDGSGSVSKEEVFFTLHGMGMGISREEIEQLLLQYDVNGDGELQFDEFLHVFAKLKSNEGHALRAKYPADVIESAATAFDLFSRGEVITLQQAKNAIIYSRIRYNADYVTQLFQQFDIDNHDYLQFEDFAKVFAMLTRCSNEAGMRRDKVAYKALDNVNKCFVPIRPCTAQERSRIAALYAVWAAVLVAFVGAAVAVTHFGSWAVNFVIALLIVPYASYLCKAIIQSRLQRIPNCERVVDHNICLASAIIIIYSCVSFFIVVAYSEYRTAQRLSNDSDNLVLHHLQRDSWTSVENTTWAERLEWFVFDESYEVDAGSMASFHTVIHGEPYTFCIAPIVSATAHDSLPYLMAACYERDPSETCSHNALTRCGFYSHLVPSKGDVPHANADLKEGAECTIARVYRQSQIYDATKANSFVLRGFRKALSLVAAHEGSSHASQSGGHTSTGAHSSQSHTASSLHGEAHGPAPGAATPYSAPKAYTAHRRKVAAQSGGSAVEEVETHDKSTLFLMLNTDWDPYLIKDNIPQKVRRLIVACFFGAGVAAAIFAICLAALHSHGFLRLFLYSTKIYYSRPVQGGLQFLGNSATMVSNFFRILSVEYTVWKAKGDFTVPMTRIVESQSSRTPQ